MIEEEGKNPKVSYTKFKEIKRLINCKKYHCIIHFLDYDTIGFMETIEKNHFMVGNNEKFIVIFTKERLYMDLPILISLFAKSVIDFDTITEYASQLDVNLISDNEGLYYLAYDEVGQAEQAMDRLSTFTKKFQG